MIFRATTKSSSSKTEIVGKIHISQFNIHCHDHHRIIYHRWTAYTNNVSGAVDIKEDPVFELSAQWKHQQCQLQRAGKKNKRIDFSHFMDQQIKVDLLLSDYEEVAAQAVDNGIDLTTQVFFFYALAAFW